MKTLVYVVLILVISFRGNSQVIEQDSLALVALYNSTNGDEWYYNNNWLDNNWPIEYWYGIEVENNRVVEINLAANDLVGKIPEEIGNLDGLRILDIHINTIDSIPNNIGNLTLLETLEISNNPIKFLPPEIGNLISLEILSFSYTQIKTLPYEIGGLVNLKYLFCDHGELELIPETIGNCISLKEIYFPVNNISNLPAGIGNCTQLTKLQLNANDIPEIPHEIGNLLNLEYLILGGNNLYEIPDEIFSLTELRYLNFAAAHLDSIPSLIGNLINLENFQFFKNEFTNIPAEIENCINLNYINGYENKINTLPSALLNLANVETLFLVRNSLTFEDIEPLIGITGFEYDSQDSIGVKIDTTVYLDSTYFMEIVTGGEFNEYQWIKNGYTIEGATNYFLEIANCNFADSGIYYCKITNTLATGLELYTRPIMMHITKQISIREIEPSEKFTLIVSPNPTHHSIKLDIEHNCNFNELELILYDIEGIPVKKYEPVNNIQIEIDISDINTGVYILQLKYKKTGETIGIQSVIKL